MKSALSIFPHRGFPNKGIYDGSVGGYPGYHSHYRFLYNDHFVNLYFTKVPDFSGTDLFKSDQPRYFSKSLSEGFLTGVSPFRPLLGYSR